MASSPFDRTLHVSLRHITLTAAQLDNLASEFCGEIRGAAGASTSGVHPGGCPEAEDLTIEFKEAWHRVEMEHALDCFTPPV